MPSDDLVCVYETSHLGKADVIRAALESEGIDCFLENTGGLSGLLPTRIYVPTDQAEAAKTFIAEHENLEEN